MRKRTNWSVDAVTGAQQYSPENAVNKNKMPDRKTDSTSGLILPQDRNNGWSTLQELDQKNVEQRKLDHEMFGDNYFNQSSYGGNRMNGSRKRTFSDKQQEIAKMILLILGSMIVIGIILSLIKNGSGFFSALGSGIESIFTTITGIIAASLFFWIVLMLLAGRFLPPRAKGYSLIGMIGLVVLGRIFPEFGSTVFGTLVLIAVLIVIMKLFIH